VRAGSSRRTGDATERGDDSGLRGAHLEDEQEQDKDEQQQRADGEVDGGIFHVGEKLGRAASAPSVLNRNLDPAPNLFF
jgi:hypothetical protein